VKILLIYPYCLEDRLQAEDVRVVPIGLYYVGALLMERHHQVEILNWHDMNQRNSVIEEMLLEKRPDVIGFSIVQANRWGGIDIAKIAKRILPAVKIVLGGVGATFLWEHLLMNFNQIDYAVLGEGEHSFLNLVECLETRNNKKIKDIKGIALRDKGKAIRTESAPRIRDLDRLPMPAKYFTFQHVASSRGCPADCSFCGSPQFWGHNVRFHSPEYFVGQLERLYQKGVTFFYVSDDTFTMKKDRVIEICKKILKKDLQITWQAISRVNHVNEEMIYWMRKAGCIQISYGVESGSEKIRRTLNKKITTSQIRKAFALTTRYGILARAYFIYGSPGETWETVQETLDLIHEIKPLSAIFYILDIFPGTALYDDFQKRHGLDDEIWLQRIEDVMYFETDPELTQDEILAFGRKLRSDYFKHLPEFAEAIQLEDREELYEGHADFLSRLGMTFSHGDYAAIDEIPDKEQTAKRLYERSLGYSPNHRAYLGLGIIQQKLGDYENSVTTLLEGVNHYPQSEPLQMCLGISLMNLGKYHDAIAYFARFPESTDALGQMAACYRALGDGGMEAEALEKLERLS
jgi:radical SAM superfamily enzyme YgiQ (UPF0313 family)